LVKALMERMVREKSPSWVPKKLMMAFRQSINPLAATQNSECRLEGSDLPPHHDTEPLDAFQIKRFRILLQLSAIRRVQTAPWDEHIAVLGAAWFRLGRQLKIAFP
jgi:hypothetical protein